MIPETRWAKTLDDAYIAYQDFGQGPVTVLAIHGWVSHLEVYWEQPRFARFMRRLAQRMRVIHFDKRGTGMSDRFERVPDLETRMDDVRAVMDAAGVDRAALVGWGSGGPAQAAFFAATHPERTIAICIDPWIHERWSEDYPFGQTDDDFERELAQDIANWGKEVPIGYGTSPPADRETIAWDAKIARFSATPGSMAAFSRTWFETDVRHVLPVIGVPTLVFAFEGDDSGGLPAARYVVDRIPGARIEVLPASEVGVRWWTDPEPYVSAIERFVGAVCNEEAELDRVLSTVLFTDVVGSTAKAAEVGDRAWRALLERHYRVVRTLLGRYRGREVDLAGDGFFATFDGPARAIRCAQAIVASVRGMGLEVRAGVHTGEVETIDGKVGGIAVNIGARIGAKAGPSEVLVSRTVKDLVVGSGFTFEDRGAHELRGVPGQWRLYAVAPDTSVSSPES